MNRNRVFLCLSFFLLVSLTPLQAPAQARASASGASSEVVLQGNVSVSQNHTYIKAPFNVPPGIDRVTLEFAYTGKEQHTALDLGLLDPSQLRCWSGGNKSLLTLAPSDATPSCLPGPIPPGKWNVLIGVPNIRPGVTSHYTAHVFLTRSSAVAAEPASLLLPLRSGPAWYRGDLHMHTAHSDGSCPSQTGKMVPCPLFFTVAAAARRGLDFIAVTDHNATSQYDEMRELQPYFDKVLLIPGREITTFYGHLNFLGVTGPLDFRLGSPTVPDVNTLLRKADRLGGLVSINHPEDPSGETCMGCGWTPPQPPDLHLIAAIEAVNGGSKHAGVPFWNQQLDKGYRLTGIGGSDNHRALEPLDQPGSIGSPTTAVYASDLSAPAILEGIRAGHVFIDLAGTQNRVLEVTAHADDQVARMGDALRAAKGQAVRFKLHVIGAANGKIVFLEDGQSPSLLTDSAVSSQDQSFSYDWTSDGQRHWFRAQVAGADGKVWLLGNPIYINWSVASSR